MSPQILVFHRTRDNLSQMLPPILACHISNARRQVQHPPLRDRTIDQLRDVRLVVADRLQPARHVQPVEETGDRFEEVRADLGVGDRGDRGVRYGGVVEDGERLAVP